MPKTAVAARAWPFVALALIAGCSSSDGDGDGTGGTGGTGASGATGGTGGTGATGGNGGSGGGADEAPVGNFTVRLVPRDDTTSTPAFTSMSGKVYDGPYPSPIVWTTTDSVEGCLLRVPKVPFCDPPCSGTELCVADDTCAPFPEAQDLGSVSVRGVGPTEFQMEQILGDYQPPTDLEIPFPPSDEGAEMEIQTAGGAYAPFSVKSEGILPLELGGPDPLPIESGKALHLEWNQGSGDAARIQIAVDVSHHGGQKGEVDCDVPDTGSLDIPERLVTGLLELGTAGFPSISVARVAIGTTRIDPGIVALTVTSPVLRELDIPGVVSCDTDEDCPAGQTCQANRTCQ